VASSGRSKGRQGATGQEGPGRGRGPNPRPLYSTPTPCSTRPQGACKERMRRASTVVPDQSQLKNTTPQKLIMLVVVGRQPLRRYFPRVQHAAPHSLSLLIEPMLPSSIGLLLCQGTHSNGRGRAERDTKTAPSPPPTQQNLTRHDSSDGDFLTMRCHGPSNRRGLPGRLTIPRPPNIVMHCVVALPCLASLLLSLSVSTPVFPHLGRSSSDDPPPRDPPLPKNPVSMSRLSRLALARLVRGPIVRRKHP
jgi:hypothetical protein